MSNCIEQTLNGILESLDMVKKKYAKEAEILEGVENFDTHISEIEKVLKRNENIEDMSPEDLEIYETATEAIFSSVESVLKPNVYKAITSEAALRGTIESSKGMSVKQIKKKVRNLFNLYAGDSVINRDKSLQDEFNRVLRQDLSNEVETLQLLRRISKDNELAIESVASIYEAEITPSLAEALSKQEAVYFKEYISAVQKAQDHVFKAKKGIGIVGADQAKGYTAKWMYNPNKVYELGYETFDVRVKENLDWEATVERLNQNVEARKQFNFLRDEARRTRNYSRRYKKIDWNNIDQEEFKSNYTRALFDDITGAARKDTSKGIGSAKLVSASAVYAKGGKGALARLYSIHENASNLIHYDLASSAKDIAMFSFFGGKSTALTSDLPAQLAEGAKREVGKGKQEIGTATKDIRREVDKFVDAYVNPVSVEATTPKILSSILKNSTIGLLGGVMRSAVIGDVTNRAFVNAMTDIAADANALSMLKNMARSISEAMSLISNKEKRQMFRQLQNSSSFLLFNDSVSRFDPLGNTELMQSSSKVNNFLLGLNNGLKTFNSRYLDTTGVTQWTEAMSGATYVEESMNLKYLSENGKVDEYVKRNLSNLSPTEKAAAKIILNDKKLLDKATVNGSGYEFVDLSLLRNEKIKGVSDRTRASVIAALGGHLDGIAQASITQVNAMDARNMHMGMGTLLGTFRTTIYKQTLGNLDLLQRSVYKSNGRKFGVLAQYLVTSMLFGMAADYVFSAVFNRESAIQKIKDGKYQEGLFDAFEITSPVPLYTDLGVKAIENDPKNIWQNPIVDFVGPAIQKSKPILGGDPVGIVDMLMQSGTDYASSHWAMQMFFSGVDAFGGEAYRLKPSFDKKEFLKQKKSKFWED